jgi:hypothetical protein
MTRASDAEQTRDRAAAEEDMGSENAAPHEIRRNDGDVANKQEGRQSPRLGQAVLHQR